MTLPGSLSCAWVKIAIKMQSKALFGSFAATIVFAFYNGFLGLYFLSLWHGSICAYYILLSVIRGILLASERSIQKRDGGTATRYQRSIFFVTSGLMLVMNIALIIPVFLMVLDQRPVRVGLIPAIASATYTTYKISASAVRLKRTKGSIFIRQLNALGLVDALVSILVLQNSLLTAVEGGITPKMFRLVAVTSAGFFLLIFAMSAIWFVRGIKETSQLS